MRILAFFIGVLVIFGCADNKKNDDENLKQEKNVETDNDTVADIPPEDLIIGVWKTTVYKGEDYPFSDTHTFNPDGSFIFEDETYKVEGTWEIKNNQVITHVNDITDNWGKIVSINTDKMVLKSIDEDSKSVYEKQ